MEEVGMRDTVDPLAGSYFIETLTKQMEEKIEEEMAEIEKQGGMVAGIKSGFVQRKVAWQAYQFERDLQHGELIKVGVNKYHTTEDEEVELHEYNEAWCESQLEGLKELKRTRDQGAVTASLKALETAARAESTNVMPFLVESCLAYATVGEMADVFRDVYGTFKEPSIF
jgi:methylmalonyl-CoA mutase N-terminal domain/subunit